MALSTATISYNLADMVGADFDVSDARVWVTTNVDGGAVVDTVGNAVRLGDGMGTLASDGTGSLNVWVPGAGSNPASWQTTVHVAYAPRIDGWRPIQRDFGPFTITGNADLADLVAEQEVPPTYLAGVITQLDGYVDQAQAAQTAAEVAAAAAVNISGISTSDGVVEALLRGTGGAGPLTREAFAVPAKMRDGAIVAPVATGVAATDTSNLQSLINAAPSGALVVLPVGRYVLNAPLVLNKDITLRGHWVREVLGGKTGSLPDIPKGSPYLDGTVLVQTAVATDGIQITAGASVHLHTLGIVFEGAHRFLNTGHGINVIPEVHATDGWGNGMTDAKWKNVKVFGHDGNHYGYNVINPMHCVLEDVRAWGGGVMHIGSIGTHFNYGNIVVIAPYGYLLAGGSAHAYWLSAEAVSGNGALNFVTMIRPQCNAVQSLDLCTVVPTDAQEMWVETNAGSSTQVRDIAVLNPDLEASSGADHTAAFGVYTAIVGAGYLPRKSTYVQRQRYNRFDPPTVAVNTNNTGTSGAGGAGTGATATLTGSNAADSKAGVVRLVAGAVPAPLARLATVTLVAPLAVNPKFVRFTHLRGEADPGFYPQNVGGTSFEIRSRTTLTAGQTYDIAFEVIE